MGKFEKFLGGMLEDCALTHFVWLLCGRSTFLLPHL